MMYEAYNDPLSHSNLALEQEHQETKETYVASQKKKPISTGDKSFDIKQRTKDDAFDVSWFIFKLNDINFPQGEETVFQRFNMFKSQLKRHSQKVSCQFRQELVDISLILTKYYLINLEFNNENYTNQRVCVIDFLMDIYKIILQNWVQYSEQFEVVFEFLKVKGEYINNLNQQDQRQWQKLLKLFSKQLFINKNFYKSHQCDYRNFIVSENAKENMDKIWFQEREDQIQKKVIRKRVPQSKAGKKKFDSLMKREREKYKKGICSNIGEFTLCQHFDEVRKNQFSKSLMYADDIFNVVIKYKVIM